jgi:lycopene beta-cyclase
MAVFDVDVALVGGGLANGIIARWLSAKRPGLRLALIEAGDRLGGNHTWSFHGPDVDAEAQALLAPMLSASWRGQEVRFPGFRRRLTTTYHAIGSDRFHQYLTEELGDQVMFADAVEIGPDAVALSDGQRITAPCVIDGRGWLGDGAAHVAVGYQKFVGLEIETGAPHGLAQPVMMDANVDQFGDFRFVYLLPFTPTRLLVEDTYYADGPDLAPPAIVERIHTYIRAQGWQAASVVRREQGVLPIVLAGSITPFLAREDEPARAGVRAGMFHPLTGYSLADAVRLADRIASLDPLTTNSVRKLSNDLATKLWEERSYYRMLNRLLFVGAKGEERRAVMARFYGLSQGLVERLYSGRTTAFDKMRILTGRPPFPIHRAVPVLPASAGWAHADSVGPKPKR